MKPGAAVLLGILLGIIGIYIYSTWGNKYQPTVPIVTPIPPGPAPLNPAERVVATACNCRLVVNTMNGTRTLHGVLRNGTCDVTSNCQGGY